MIRVAILGSSGYTALELCKLLVRHPEVQITALGSRTYAGQPIAAVHPSLEGRVDVVCENVTPAQVAERADCVFGCLPHGASATVIKELLKGTTRVVDFSADYRLTDADVYQQWYGLEHVDPGHLKTAVYGLPELYRDEIASAQLVANPGCYPTSAILGLAPLLASGVIEPDGIIVDSKSGVSGAGRDPKPSFHFPECNESMAAYGVGAHRHMPEIDQLLSSQSTGGPVEVLFTPHLVPMDRGILSTCYAIPSGTTLPTEAGLLGVLRDAYANEPFVHIVDHLPATKHVMGTNFCHVTARVARGRVIVISTIDNLIKGASGAAVQNFNVMHGFEETTALL